MHLLANCAEETTSSPFPSISSKHLEYLDNLLIVASGILEYFNFCDSFHKSLKKFIRFSSLCQVLRPHPDPDIEKWGTLQVILIYLQTSETKRRLFILHFPMSFSGAVSNPFHSLRGEEEG
jgi:hypothetical protein